MPARWFKRDRDRPDGEELDPVEARIRKQAQRAGRTVAEEQERILREVLPGIRRAAAEAGMTMAAYLQLDPVAYHRLLATSSGSRSLVGRREGLIDHESYLRLRRWIEAAALRSGITADEWVTRAGAHAPVTTWQRLIGRAITPRPTLGDHVPVGDPSDPRGDTDATDRPLSGDALIDRLERLTALRDAGALTEEEFLVQKQRLLDEAG